MPRTARSTPAGICYHVINRGNARATVFHDQVDYRAFFKLAIRATERVPLDVVAFCLMPNHFHFVLRSHVDEGLARWTHWLMTAHAHHHRRRYATTGHIWQGRYKPFPIQDDGHLLAVMRYVEGNALRAGLVARAQQWPWGSLAQRTREATDLKICDAPVPLPSDWVEWVNESETATELEVIRQSVARGTPFGDTEWARSTAKTLNLEYTLRPRGRPPRVR